MITTMNTGLIANVQKLGRENQTLTAKVGELEKRLTAIEQALTAPLPEDGGVPLDGAPNEWPDERKIQILREWREARKQGKQDEVYEKYGVKLGHIRFWGRLDNGQG